MNSSPIGSKGASSSADSFWVELRSHLVKGAGSVIWTFLLSLVILASALLWPSYNWPPSLAGVALGALAAAIAYLWLTVHSKSEERIVVKIPAPPTGLPQGASKPSGEEQPVSGRQVKPWPRLWATSLITAIGTFVLVAVQRSALGSASSLLPPPGGPPVSWLLVPLLLFVPGLVIIVALALTAGLSGRRPAVVVGIGVLSVGVVATVLTVSKGSDMADLIGKVIDSFGKLAEARSSTVPMPIGTPTASADDGLAIVRWSRPREGGSAITTYFVTSSPGDFTVAVPGGVTSATIHGLKNCVPYRFNVTAANSIGPSLVSAESNAVTPGFAPGPPASVRASPGNAQATVTWQPPSTDGGARISGYTILSVTGGLAAISKTVSAETTAYTVNGLSNGVTYVFEVISSNCIGPGPGASSNAVTPIRPDP